MILARALMVALLAAFTAASVVSAAGAATMGVEMAMAADGGMGIADCDSCDDDGKGPCNDVCVTPLLATVSPEAILPTPPPGRASATNLGGFVDHTGPPELHPPQFGILS